MNKKAQVYPVFIVIFTLVALTFAYLALNEAKTLKDINGEDITIGEKQSAVFKAIQRQDAINMYVEASAKMAAYESLESLKDGCRVEEGYETLEYESECGSFVYDKWSDDTKICLPDCFESFKENFNKAMRARAADFYQATSFSIPSEYEIDISRDAYGFNITGKATSGFIVRLSSTEAAKEEAEEPSEISVQEEILQTMQQSKPSYAWPTNYPEEVLNSCYGFRLYGGKRKVHQGVDIRAKGSEVLSPAPGIVRVAGDLSKTDSMLFNDRGSLLDSPSCWGEIVIEHAGGLRTRILHMSRIDVQKGQLVDAGDVLGLAGGRGRVNQDGRFIASCSDNAYPVHIHLETRYEDLSRNAIEYQYIPTEYSEDYLSRIPQYIVLRKESASGRNSPTNLVNPLCFLKKPAADDAPNCEYQFNTDLESICPRYDISGEAENLITGNFIDVPLFSQYLTNKLLLPDFPVSTGYRGVYEFEPSFTISVAKEIQDPLDEPFAFVEKTWNECTDDLQVCLDEHIKAHNEQESKAFKISYASQCRKSPQDAFLVFAEELEDCFSAGFSRCTCEINLTKLYSPYDLKITLTAQDASFSYLKEDEWISAGRHTFQNGVLSFDTPFKILELDFEQGRVSNVRLESKDVWYDQIESENYPKLLIARLEEADRIRNQLLYESELPQCPYKKDKFTLCATPVEKEGSYALSETFFALQFRDEPPKAVCSDGDLVTITASEKNDDDIRGIAEFLGFDLSSFLSFIPVLNILSTTYTITDIIASLPDERKSNLNVVVNAEDKDVAGYKVYCDMPFGISDTAIPDAMVLLENRLAGVESAYEKFLKGLDCYLPVADALGRVSLVRGIRGAEKDGKAYFKMGSCGARNVVMSKMLPNEYCVTLVPVDKNAQETRGCMIKSCSTTNSLLELALEEIGKREVSGLFFGIEFPLPDSIKPYVKIPSGQDLALMATGERDFSFADYVNFDAISSEAKSFLPGVLTEAVGKEIANGAVFKSIEDLGDAGRQAAVSAVSSAITSDEAREVFDDVVNARSFSAVQQAALAKGTQFLDNTGIDDILRQMPSQVASELRKLDPASKVEDLKDAALENLALRDRIIGKALENGCRISDDLDAAMSCLGEKASSVYDDLVEDYSELATKSLEKLDKRELLRELVQNDATGEARKLIASSISKLEDYAKGEILRDILDSSELDKFTKIDLLKKLSPDTIFSALQNTELRSLIQSTLADNLKIGLDGFLRGECVD